MKTLLRSLWRLVIVVEMMFEVVMGFLDMKVDQVAEEVADMDENG